MTKPPRSESLALDQQLAYKVFPGRSMLMVQEVADALGVTDRHVVTLINEQLIGAVEITGRGNKTSAEHWRVPVAAYDDYIRRRSNISEERRGK